MYICHQKHRFVFGVKRDEVTGDWRKQYNEELHNLHSLSSISRMIRSRKMRWVGNMAQIGEKRSAYRILVRKLGGTRPLGRQRRMWVDNIDTVLRMGWYGLDLSDSG
jgi:hypothetical protein